MGAIDVIVNNAGVMYYTYMTNLMEDDWERTIDINCKGVTNGVGAVLNGMVERKRGHIVNMSSDAGRRVRKQLTTKKLNIILDVFFLNHAKENYYNKSSLYSQYTMYYVHNITQITVT